MARVLREKYETSLAPFASATGGEVRAPYRIGVLIHEVKESPTKYGRNLSRRLRALCIGTKPRDMGTVSSRTDGAKMGSTRPWRDDQIEVSP